MTMPPEPDQPDQGRPDQGWRDQSRPDQGWRDQSRLDQDQPHQDRPYSGRPYSGQLYRSRSYQSQSYSGQPYSYKSKVIAGLLQLVPGVLVGLGGIGRLYAGHNTLAALQLAATVVGWLSFWCGFLLVLPWVVFGAIWLWFVIDGI